MKQVNKIYKDEKRRQNATSLYDKTRHHPAKTGARYSVTSTPSPTNRHFWMDAQLLKLSHASPLPINFKWTPTPRSHLNLPSISRPNTPIFPLFSRNLSATAARRSDATFDEAAYEAERLSLDAAARDSMAQKSAIEGDDPKAWKWVIRKRVWDLMEARNIAQFPRPVHHRIPNFVGAHIAAQKVFDSSWIIL